MPRRKKRRLKPTREERREYISTLVNIPLLFIVLIVANLMGITVVTENPEIFWMMIVIFAIADILAITVSMMAVRRKRRRR